MKVLLLAALLAGGTLALRADGSAELKAIESRYDTTKFATDEPSRAKYILELARLRWKLAREGSDDWQAVDAEIARYPAPANSNTATFTKLRLGLWHSPRHDYLFKSNGTWIMDPELNIPDATHGNWSIEGNHYSENLPADMASPDRCTIILLDHENFIYTSGGSTFYEKRTLGHGLPLRRDGT